MNEIIGLCNSCNDIVYNDQEYRIDDSDNELYHYECTHDASK